MLRRKEFKIVILVFTILFLAITLTSMAAAQSEMPPEIEQQSFISPHVPIKSNHFVINWSVTGSGSGTFTSAHFRLSSTVGQPVSGNLSSSTFQHHPGFWQRFIQNVFLPMLLR